LWNYERSELLIEEYFVPIEEPSVMSEGGIPEDY